MQHGEMASVAASVPDLTVCYLEQESWNGCIYVGPKLLRAPDFE